MSCEIAATELPSSGALTGTANIIIVDPSLSTANQVSLATPAQVLTAGGAMLKIASPMNGEILIDSLTGQAQGSTVLLGTVMTNIAKLSNIATGDFAIPDAPMNGLVYGRKNGNWVVLNEEAFLIVVQFQYNITAGDSLSLPVFYDGNGFTVAVAVAWGDGTTTVYTPSEYLQIDKASPYESSGIYTVSVFAARFPSSVYGVTIDQALPQTNMIAADNFSDTIRSIYLAGSDNMSSITGIPPLMTSFVVSSSSMVSAPLPSEFVTVYNATECALSESNVDAILAQLVTNGKLNGTVTLSGGSSAPPSSAGLDSAATLVTNGWTVTTN